MKVIEQLKRRHGNFYAPPEWIDRSGFEHALSRYEHYARREGFIEAYPELHKIFEMLIDFGFLLYDFLDEADVQDFDDFLGALDEAAARTNGEAVERLRQDCEDIRESKANMFNLFESAIHDSEAAVEVFRDTLAPLALAFEKMQGAQKQIMNLLIESKKKGSKKDDQS